SVCANVSYSEEDLNVRLTLSIDGNVFIDEELSARNPPPICAGIPGLEKYGSVCIDLYNMDYTKSSLSGCIKLEISVLTIKALDVKFGCFKIPLQEPKDPPPICEGIPDLLKYGSVCIDFYNMEYSKSSLSGCMKLLVRVLKIKALDLKLGCFKIPLMGHNIKGIGQETALLYRSEVAVSNAPQRRQNYSEMTTEEKIEFIRRLGLLSKADTNNGL
ncbi:hypothetical protein FSP39_006137, partial [Pinctada imbricata]